MRILNAIQAALLIVLFGNCIQVNAQNASVAAPPASIPTFSTADIARTGFFYAGGKYAGAPGKEVMDGAEYVEVMVPKKIRHPYPLVFFHGAGQTGTDWLQTPDGRPGWAYFFITKRMGMPETAYVARAIDRVNRKTRPITEIEVGDE